MNLPLGWFPTHLFRRRPFIDPAQHFAVRVKGRYARPISRTAFASIMGHFNGQATTLMRLAALGREQAQRSANTGEPGEGAHNVLCSALERSAAIRMEYDEFISPISFNDHRAYQLVEDTHLALSHADRNVREALKLIERCICRSAS